MLSFIDGNETERTWFGCRISPTECAGQVSRSQLDSSYPRKTGDVDPGRGSRLSYLNRVVIASHSRKVTKSFSLATA